MLAVRSLALKFFNSVFLHKSVADFWPTVSCGILSYDMSRTQSIMRVATTASPVSQFFLARVRLIHMILHPHAEVIAV